MATLADIARAADLSSSIVSHVVIRTRRDSPETARAAQEIDFVGCRPGVLDYTLGMALGRQAQLVVRESRARPR